MRELATVQRISAIDPIVGADSIEVASILGWKVVVKKEEFSVGDMIVYCEIDSLLPIRSEFEFLREGCYKKNENGEGFRIKTIKLRGQVSQGICFPLSILPEGEYADGEEVTEELEVSQYTPSIPANLAGEVKGQFPSFIPKTDETRVQVLQEVLERNKNLECYITEKVDGTSVTYYLKDGEFGVCSRNLELKETSENLLWKIARKLRVEEKLRSLNMNIAFQGELVGPGIQKNVLKLSENKVLFFNIFDIDKYKYYDYSEFTSLLSKLNLECVPVIEDTYYLQNSINSIIESAKGSSSLNRSVIREGIVIRPKIESNDLLIGRLTLKAINNDYLLKHED